MERVVVVGRAIGVVMLAVLAGACGGGGGPVAPVRGVEVVATTTILGDLLAELVGDAGTVTTLMGIGADPHEFQASAVQAESLREADLVVASGYGLEEGLEDVLDAARDDGANVVEAGSEITPLAGPDPHWWQDPQRTAAVVRSLAGRLATADGDLEDAVWEQRGAELAESIEEVDGELTAGFGAIPEDRRVLVTNHDAFGYFAEHFGFTIVGTVIPGGDTLAEPGAADLEALVDAIREHDAPAIFVETTSPTRLADAVAAEVGREISVVELFSDSIGQEGSGAETYLDVMRTNAQRITDALTRV